jgi:hypothetical protein
MKRFILYILISLFSLNCQQAAAESTLVKLAKADSKDIVQIFFTFDTIPKFSHEISNKRVDIILEETITSDETQIFASDNRIVKVLPKTSDGRSVVSLFFRYRPQNVKIETSRDGKLVVEVLLGNRYSKSYQDLSERLKGLTVIESEPVNFTNPLTSSPYADDWSRFIRDYEDDINISVPLEFTAPPFPVIALIPPGLEKNMQILPLEFYELADQQLWDDMQPLILEQLKSTKDIATQKMLALTYGEALLHHKDFEGAYKQLYLLQKEYPEEHIGIIAKYLLTLLEAQVRDPFLADFEYRKLEDIITPTNPLAPYFLISRIETALATRQYSRMKQLIDQDNVPLPGNTQKIKELRLGDYYNVTDQPIKSFVSYQLLRDTPLLQAHPFSLNGYCNTLYRHRKYDLAANCYRDLGPQVNDNTSLGLITYRKGMSELHFKPDVELVDSFARIEDAFPDTEAGFRAALKQTDLKYLDNRGWGKQAAKDYHTLASVSVSRSTVAEAALKEALIYSELGDATKSVELLMQFLRDFRIGELRDSAYGLLIKNLPGVLQQHIEEGNYMEALVLAKQNRDLFQNNWLDVSLFADIANAYQKIGIFSEAQRVYLYLIEVVDVEKREKFFLPLIRSVFDQGEYGLVEDFASQYSYNYPNGNDSEQILILRIKALIAAEQFLTAREMLPSPLPENREFHLLAANLYFRDDEYQNTREALDPLLVSGEEISAETRFMLAESRYQLEDFTGAEALFEALTDDEQFGEQSSYRLAQLERQKGNEKNALKLFEKIVEKGKDTLWRKYAERELEYSRLTKTIDNLIDG